MKKIFTFNHKKPIVKIKNTFMKNKKKLEKLKVESFITSLSDEQKETVKGGNTSITACPTTNPYYSPCPTTWTSNCPYGSTVYGPVC